jgi:hypothetical protein
MGNSFAAPQQLCYSCVCVCMLFSARCITDPLELLYIRYSIKNLLLFIYECKLIIPLGRQHADPPPLLTAPD